MPILSEHISPDGSDVRLAFHCPGCGFCHVFILKAARGPTWTWNESMDKPTFSPSLKNTWDEGDPPVEKICHLIVVDGQIQFCADCWHELRGKTVPIPEDV
jgi:hypothetical protein